MFNLSRRWPAEANAFPAAIERFGLIGIVGPASSLEGRAEATLKAVFFSTVAAAFITLSATSAFAGPTTDGNTPDFYAIQQGLPYAGAPGSILRAREYAMPSNPALRRAFLSGRAFVHLAGHRRSMQKEG